MKTSIVVSMYNARGKVVNLVDTMFIPSVVRNGSLEKELVLLDDASPLEKETSEMVSKHLPELKNKFGNVIFERNSKNMGFGESYNKGIGMTSGKFLVLCNDDLYLPLNSIDSLISVLDRNREIGAVGPITNCKASLSPQYCKQAPKLEGYSFEDFQKQEDFAKKAKELMGDRLVETDFFSGSCLASRKDVLKYVGRFDKRFKHGYYEDNDLIKMINKTKKVVISAGTYISHDSPNGASISMKQMPFKSVYYVITNAFKFHKKHEHSFKYFIKDGIKRISMMSGRNTVSELFDEMKANKTILS